MREKNAKAPAPRPVTARGDLPPLDLLRSFEAAARHLSFTLAGQELFLTQSAVSRQIQQVEAHLGVPLFARKHRALELTEAGQLLHRAVVDSLERLRDATARVRATTGLRQVALTSTNGFASLWLIPRLAHFTAANPQVDVRISATQQLLDLERTQIDLAVRFVPMSEGSGAPLFEETLMPVCAPSLVKSKRNPLRKPADLVHHTLLGIDMPQGMAMTSDWEPWFHAIGIDHLKVKNSVRFTTYSDAVAAAVAGQGVVIGRMPLLAEHMKDKRLVAPFGGGAASRRAYYVVESSRGRANPHAQAFVAWLRAEAEIARAKAALA